MPNKKEVFILKKTLIWLSVVLIIVVIGIKIAWGYFGLQDYYVKVTENGKVATENVGIGKYNYNVKAYDINGNEITVQFSTKEEVKLNTFLHVEVLKPKKDKVNAINSYEEVTSEQVPEKAKEKLNVKQ